MSQTYSDYRTGPVSADRTQALVSAFMRRVYWWMTGGLAITALVAYYLLNYMLSSAEAASLIINLQTGGFTMLWWGAVIVEIGIVLIMGRAIPRMQVGTATGVFLLYSALNGVTLTPLLYIFTGQSIFQAFFVSAGAFAVMSIYGSITKKDLTSFGSFLIMGVFGLFIASILTYFLKSTMMFWIICVVGLGIFMGLTAYYTQAFRNMVQEAANEVTVKKMAILGALMLYIAFIGIFQYVLILMGDRR